MTFGISRFLPTDYTGPQSNIAPLRCFPREPTTTDKKYPIGQLIIIGKNPSSGTQGEFWYLSKFDASGDAIWLQLLSGAGSPGVDSLTTDDGAPVVAPDGNGNINVLGGTSITTSGQGPSTVTIDLDADVANSYVSDAGTATPAANVINILGGTGVDTSGAGLTVTINASAAVPTGFTTDAGVATPAANNINVVGSGSTSTSAAGDTITIASTGGGISCVAVTVTGPTAMSVDTCYIANTTNPEVCGLTLPVTAALGSIIEIIGKGTGGFQINQGAGQTIQLVTSVTTGGAGVINSSEARSTLTMKCITADNVWQIISSTGNLIFT